MEKLKISFDYILRIALAGTFIYAGILKFLRPDLLFTDISNYQIVGVAMTYISAYFLSSLEIVSSLCLFSKKFLGSALFIISGMLLVFIIAIISAWARGLDISCGCFGNANETTSYAEVILRDILLLFICVIIYLLNFKKNNISEKNL